MDKNTVVGLVIIGLILSVFAIFNKPSEEDLNGRSNDIKRIAADSLSGLQDKQADTLTKKSEVQAVAKDSSSSIQKSSLEEQEVKSITLENEELILDFSTLGGQLEQVRLKKFENYKNFAKKDGEVEPLILFKKGDALNEIVLPYDGKNIRTSREHFLVKELSKDKVVFEWTHPEGGSVTFSYLLKPGKFDIDYQIALNGFAGKVNPANILFNWDVAFRKTERLFSEQRRVSTICYQYDKEGFSYLSEMADDKIDAEDQVNWIAYKQSYFSSILRPENGFGKDGSFLKVKNYEAGDEREFSHLKDYSASMNLNLKSTDGALVHMNWYFGPNESKLLKSYDSGYDQLLNYGWGLFRWINIYAVEPIFYFLQNTGMSIGIAILLLTIILKLVLMPIQWKMYTSSAKMRILKPEIDELNKKFPNKEDAMKKQSEMMTLYRESGASPFAGCVPMLIQMPILLAVFRFFPSTFDLRQQSFLWADDLSSYDSIYDFGFNIWLYGDHISLFTLLMAVTTLAYTAMNSGNMQQQQQPGMPNMKVIMYIFPVMMIFFFNNYSSGLSYYYFISTLISILIMLAIKKFFVDEEKLKAKMAARKEKMVTQPKKKSKFQEKLEQMQQAQKDQMKKKK